MQFSLNLDNRNELSVDEIAAAFWGDLNDILKDTHSWPTHSMALVGQAHSGIEYIAKNWCEGGETRIVLNALNDFDEQELLHQMVRAEKTEIHLLILISVKPQALNLVSADLKSRLVNLSVFLGIEPKKQILNEVFEIWCRHYGVKIKKNAILALLDSMNFDFVTLYQLVCLIKSKVATGSKLSNDEILGMKQDLERENRLL